MDFILYIIFVFTLLLIIFSVNEYFESCRIMKCKTNFALNTDSTSKVTTCVECKVPNAESYFENTCNPSKCTGKFTPNVDKCSACSVDNALDYADNGSCDVIKCSPGYIPSSDKRACTPCTNNLNVYTYGDSCNIL